MTDDDDGSMNEVLGSVYGDHLDELIIGYDDGILYVELRSDEGRFAARVTFDDGKKLPRFLRDMHKKLPT